MLASLSALIFCGVFIKAISLLLFNHFQDLVVVVDGPENFDCDSLLF